MGGHMATVNEFIVRAPNIWPTKSLIFQFKHLSVGYFGKVFTRDNPIWIHSLKKTPSTMNIWTILSLSLPNQLNTLSFME